MNEGQQTIKKAPDVIDKKRLFIGIVILTLVSGGIFVFGKKTLPKVTEEFKNATTAREKIEGEVAGISDPELNLEVQRKEVQNKIDEIKSSVTSLKPEDIKEQATVKKILSDLDDLAKQASESAKILDVKGNICEEAKKRFCE